jgi:uncharacterized protein YuzE
MESITLTYFTAEDVLYIPLKNENSSIGDEEYQDDVTLYRNDSNEIVAIEIQKFSMFNENEIKVCSDKVIDLKTSFEKIRMFISCRDIIDTDPEQFEQTLKEWGIEVIKEDDDGSTKSVAVETKAPSELIEC